MSSLRSFVYVIFGLLSLTSLHASGHRLRELHTLKGHVESVVRLKNLDISTIQGSYTV